MGGGKTTRLLVLVVLFEAVALRTLASSTDGLALSIIDLMDRIGVGAVPVETVLFPAEFFGLDGNKEDGLLVLLFWEWAGVASWLIGRSDEDGRDHEVGLRWLREVCRIDGQHRFLSVWCLPRQDCRDCG